MSTQAQILANQANAQKSTGPTSETGMQKPLFRTTASKASPILATSSSSNLEQNPQDETECILCAA